MRFLCLIKSKNSETSRLFIKKVKTVNPPSKDRDTSEILMNKLRRNAISPTCPLDPDSLGSLHLIHKPQLLVVGTGEDKVADEKRSTMRGRSVPYGSSTSTLNKTRSVPSHQDWEFEQGGEFEPEKDICIRTKTNWL